jgi:hypothetical protein
MQLCSSILVLPIGFEDFALFGRSMQTLVFYFFSRPGLGTRGCGFARVFLNIFAIMPRTREAGTSAFIMRSRHPEIIKLNDGSAIIE